MTNKQFVLSKYPEARACCGDNPDSRIIMAPGLCLSGEHVGHDDWDEYSAEKDA
jgi:hypothetical protein